MPRLIWSPSALRDVSRLHRFLLRKDRSAATRAVKAIRRGIRLLEQNPDAGRPVPGLEPEYREWPMEFGSGAYVATYRIHDDRVVVLAVRHSREAGP